MNSPQSEIVLYTTFDGQVKIDTQVVVSILENTTQNGNLYLRVGHAG